MSLIIKRGTIWINRGRVLIVDNFYIWIIRHGAEGEEQVEIDKEIQQKLDEQSEEVNVWYKE